MNWHRLLCTFSCHWWVRLTDRGRSCAVCFQSQEYIEDANGQHGFWRDMPNGAVVWKVKITHKTEAA